MPDQLILEKFFFQFPGYPSLESIFRADVARGLVLAQAAWIIQKPQIIIGVDGFDIEIWVVGLEGARLFNVKLSNIKNLNSQLGHEGLNLFREYFLTHLDQKTDEFGQNLLKTATDLVKASRFVAEFFQKVGQTVANQNFEKHRLHVSMKCIAAEERNFGKRLSPAPSPQDCEALIENLRRKVSFATREHQLLCHFLLDEIFKDEFSSRQLAGMDKDLQLLRQAILAEYNQQLSEFTKRSDDGTIEAVWWVHSRGYEEFKWFQQAPDHVVRAMTEHYHRRIVQVTEYYKPQATGGEWGVLRSSELSPTFHGVGVDRKRAILRNLISESPTSFSRDILAKIMVERVKKQEGHMWLLVADRDEVLFLNAQRGSETIDSGLMKLSSYCNSRIKEFEKRPSARIGREVFGHFCTRHVDELIILFAFSGLALSLAEKELADSLLREFLNELHMYEKTIGELKVSGRGLSFDSQVTGMMASYEIPSPLSTNEIFDHADRLSIALKSLRKSQVIQTISALRRHETVAEVVFDRNSRQELILSVELNVPLSADLRSALESTFASSIRLFGANPKPIQSFYDRESNRLELGFDIKGLFTETEFLSRLDQDHLKNAIQVEVGRGVFAGLTQSHYRELGGFESYLQFIDSEFQKEAAHSLGSSGEVLNKERNLHATL